VQTCPGYPEVVSCNWCKSTWLTDHSRGVCSRKTHRYIHTCRRADTNEHFFPLQDGGAFDGRRDLRLIRYHSPAESGPTIISRHRAPAPTHISRIHTGTCSYKQAFFLGSVSDAFHGRCDLRLIKYHSPAESGPTISSRHRTPAPTHISRIHMGTCRYKQAFFLGGVGDAFRAICNSSNITHLQNPDPPSLGATRQTPAPTNISRIRTVETLSHLRFLATAKKISAKKLDPRRSLPNW
jgi:hypothetical protein